jgi:hypothetical protein
MCFCGVKVGVKKMNLARGLARRVALLLTVLLIGMIGWNDLTVHAAEPSGGFNLDELFGGSVGGADEDGTKGEQKEAISELFTEGWSAGDEIDQQAAADKQIYTQLFADGMNVTAVREPDADPDAWRASLMTNYGTLMGLVGGVIIVFGIILLINRRRSQKIADHDLD